MSKVKQPKVRRLISPTSTAGKRDSRVVAYIPPDAFIEGRGFRVALVVEGEDHYHLTGTWPYSAKVGEVMPWFWGMTLKEAEETANNYNAKRGISQQDAAVIILQSMMAGAKRRM